MFTNGHDSQDPEKEKRHIFNLDNFLGKGLEFNQGEYTALYTDVGIAPKSEPTSVGIGNFFVEDSDQRSALPERVHSVK